MVQSIKFQLFSTWFVNIGVFMCKSKFFFFTFFDMWQATIAVYRKKASALYRPTTFHKRHRGQNVAKCDMGGDGFTKCLSASDVLFEWPQKAVWGNDLWHVHLSFKVLVHKTVLLTSFHIFSISRNLVKLKLYISGQNDFSIKVLRFSTKSFLIFRS